MTKPLFDTYVVVDWSAASVPVTGTDSIWIAVCRDGLVELQNPATRAEAAHQLEAVFAKATASGERCLAGFDFPFGYPSGLAEAIDPGGDWQSVWAWIAEALSDGPDNANNRFDIAARLNTHFPGDGPFWGNGLKRDIDGLPRKKPSGWGEALPMNQRDCDRRATAAQEVWKLSGVGSVGGQALTGIAALETLRRKVGAAVWPFETLGEGSSHVLAEVFPSLVPLSFPKGSLRDTVQVETLARALWRLDKAGTLAEMLNAPARLSTDIRRYEATILGLDHQKEMAMACAPEPPPRFRYIKDPKAIYAQSFATVRNEARMERFGPGMDALATRVIHACGMIEVADRLSFSDGAYAAGHAALAAGAPILCDCKMVAAGIIPARLPCANEVKVTLNDERVPNLAQALGTTRSAAAVDLWKDQIEGAVVAIGNAPTALFHLLERLAEGWPKPALILGFPVGFVGAAEAKAALCNDSIGCNYIALRGAARRIGYGLRRCQRACGGIARGGPMREPWLHIVGIGEDGIAGLSPATRAVVEAAEVIVGGDRHHDLSRAITAERVAWPSPFDAMIETILGLKGRRAVILVTGDPLWFSVGAPYSDVR